MKIVKLDLKEIYFCLSHFSAELRGGGWKKSGREKDKFVEIVVKMKKMRKEQNRGFSMADGNDRKTKPFKTEV